MKKVILTSLIVLISLQMFSQAKKKKATLLFKDGKELNCLARISGDNIRYVESDRRAEEIVVDDKELNGIKIWMNDQQIELYYKTEEGKAKPKLMQLVLKGKMKLYRISDTYEKNIGFSSNENYFNDKSASTVYFLDSSENKGFVFRFARNFEENAKKYFADCNTLSEKIGKDDFRKKDIFKIVLYYNENCN